MLFNSLEFLFVFLPVVLILYWLTFKNRYYHLALLNISSLVFYGAWNYKFIPLLIFSVVVDFYLAKWMYRAPQAKRKKYLMASVLSNLGLLGFFKYFYFATNSATTFLSLFGLEWAAPAWNIVLPVGISFYTFQSMSYTIDVYRDKSKPYDNIFVFSAYVCFFPQLVAGPIIRHNELMDQIFAAIKSKFSAHNFACGIHFFTIGLAKKVLIADRIAAAIDPAILLMPNLTSFEATLCAVGYSLQLYFDFSGYSCMAMGLGYFFNLKFPVNFNSPYKSESITEFWRRWHMTLSSWLRDYLYISLGGSRHGKFKTYRNLFLTMVIGGLWHGAGWNYVLWGTYHGLWLVVERFLGLSIWQGPRFVRQLQVFAVVTCGWIFFRSPDIAFAADWFGRIFSFQGGFALEHFETKHKDRFLFILPLSIWLVGLKNSHEMLGAGVKSVKHAIFYAIIFYLSIMYLSSESPFLYFQF